MADYNSKWTGADIDDAVEKSKNIEHMVELYSDDTGTNLPFPIANLPVNPGTGDRTGFYIINYRYDDNGSMVMGNSSIIVNELDSDCAGSSLTYYSDSSNELVIKKVLYRSSNESFEATAQIVNIIDGSGYSTEDLHIHGIYRLQEA